MNLLYGVLIGCGVGVLLFLLWYFRDYFEFGDDHFDDFLDFDD